MLVGASYIQIQAPVSWSMSKEYEYVCPKESCYFSDAYSCVYVYCSFRAIGMNMNTCKYIGKESVRIVSIITQGVLVLVKC